MILIVKCFNLESSDACFWANLLRLMILIDYCINFNSIELYEFSVVQKSIVIGDAQY